MYNLNMRMKTSRREIVLGSFLEFSIDLQMSTLGSLPWSFLSSSEEIIMYVTMNSNFGV